MRVHVFSIALLAFAASASASDRMVNGFPDLPKDAQDVAERSLACQHFWGEVSGTGDERDKEVAGRLKELKCDRVAGDLRQMRTKYRNSARILTILSEAALD